jgi:prevent-host-death family protein
MYGREGPAMHWQVQEAKQRFSEILRQAHDDGPQIVTRHGEEVAVVIGIEEYRRLTGSRPDFKDFLLSAPDLAALDIRRPSERAPTVELDDERAG